MRIKHQLKRGIDCLVSQLRKVDIFPRLLLVFCTLLIASTVFITFFNQKNYADEAETNAVKYLSILVQNASLELKQEKEQIEQGLSKFIQDENVLLAIQENSDLQAKADNDAKVAEKMQKNRYLIEQALRSVKKRVPGVKAAIFVAEDAQYSMLADKDDGNAAFVRNLEDFYASEIYKKAITAHGYPSWLDSVQDTSNLFFENESDLVGILGCVTVSYQVYAPNTRTPLGVLVCCVYPQHFTNMLSKYSSQDGGNTFIVGAKGMVEGISASLSAPPFLHQNNNSLMQRVFSQHQGSLLLESQGRELLVNYCGEPDFPIHIVNLTYRDYAMRTVREVSKMSFIAMGVVIVIGAFGFYLAAISISRPVNRLIAAMKKVGAGDFSAVYKAASHDEIGLLCEEFDLMVADMKKLIDQVYVAEIREKSLELGEKTAQLNALQMQISPHFLYNTLDMIRWQCLYENGGESAASDMIEKFCTLLRMTIKGDQKKETVQDSLLHAQTYLEVVNYRHTNKIQLQTQLSFDPAAYLLPCLSLQPILENAIRHGFSGEEMENSTICIAGSLDGKGNLQLRVTDNGRGMSDQQLDALRASVEKSELTKNSIGLQNVNQRCRLCYGENYGIRITSKSGVGTEVVLTIPAEPAMYEGGKPIV